LADAAAALVGTPFRLHGRDPATGLDCIGVLVAALSRIGRPPSLPNGYALRSRTVPDFAAIAARLGMVRAETATEPGDVILARTSPCQVHLLIAARGTGFVHAHAGLRRVVLSPGLLAWPELYRCRLAGSS
jgi:hypothetical protein